MSQDLTAVWSLHGVAVEMTSADSEIAAAAARLMQHWPTDTGGRADIRFDLTRAGRDELARQELPADRYDHWPGLACGADGHLLWFRREQCGSLVISDLTAGSSRAYVADSHVGPEAVDRALNGLLLMALVQMLARQGLFSIHACGAARDGAAAVAAAGPGSGKSTLAAAMAQAGLAMLADDRVLVRRTPSGVQCLGWPGPVNLTEESLALFPALSGAPLDRGVFSGKLALSPGGLNRAQSVDAARPRLLLFPAIGGEPESSLQELAREDALARLVPCSLFWVHRDVLAEHLAALREVVAASQCYRLELGRDLDQVGRLVAELLAAG